MDRISKNLKDFMVLFEFISTIKEVKLRTKLLKQLNSNDKFNRAVREVAFNIVERNIPLSSKDKALLRPFGPAILKLARASNPSKRSQVVQKGKGVVLTSVLSALAFKILNGLLN